MKKSVEYAVKLFVICAIATLVLAFTNNATAPVIEEAQKQKELKAFTEVFPGLEETKPVADKSVLNDNIVSVNEAIVGGKTEGYDGPISFVVGAKTDGTVTGMKIINQTETTGFGASVAKPEYAAGMQGVSLNQTLKMEGAGGKPDVMPAISGATRTSTAMLKAMNMVVEAQAKLTGGAGQSNASETK